MNKKNQDRLEIGDVLFHYSPTILGRLINWFQSLREGKKFRCSHVSMYIGNGQIIEARSKVEINDIPWSKIVAVKRYEEKDGFDGQLNKILTKIEKINLLAYALDHVGEDYAYVQIAIIALSKLFGAKGFDADPHKTICSEYVSNCYKSISINFAPEKSAMTTPLDLAFSKKLVEVK